MKNLYLLVVILLLSCGQKTKEKSTATVKAQNATNVAGDTPRKEDKASLEMQREIKAVTSTKAITDTLVNSVIKQLGLNPLKIKKDLVVSKIQPHNPNETIVVIPEIVGDYDEHFFELNNYIVLVDNTTKKITHKYFESSKTNGWVSDPVQLREIAIDTAPYILVKDTRAFGIRVHFVGMSHANPYENKTLSLFIKSDDTLKKVVHNYDVVDNGGEWDTDCAGEFTDVNNTLIMSKEKTNDFFDIKVKSKITESKAYLDENGECDSKDKITTEGKLLKFNGEMYKENSPYSIKINEINSVQFHTLKKEKVSVKKKKVKITDFNEAIKTLKGIVEFDTPKEGYLFIKKIKFKNGDIKTNKEGVLSECSFAAYFPDEDILLCTGGHETDVSFNLKNGKETEETGNPEQMNTSPKQEFRLNGYFGGQECYSYFIQRKTNNGYEKIIQLNEVFDELTNVWLCTIGEVFWINEKTLYLEETNLGEKSTFFKIEINYNDL